MLILKTSSFRNEDGRGMISQTKNYPISHSWLCWPMELAVLAIAASCIGQCSRLREKGGEFR